MNYEEIRHAEIRESYDRVVDAFTKRYRKNAPTIILLPGAPGTQLDRSREQPSAPSSTRYASAWIRYGIVPLLSPGLRGDFKYLQINPDGRDFGDHIVVPNGPLHFAFRDQTRSRRVGNNYYYTQQFFENNGLNYLFFGYDWRRSIEESAGWLNYTITRLKNRTYAVHGVGPENVNLLCHSLGGIIAKYFLHTYYKSAPEKYEHVIDKVVTAGTPFYGTPRYLSNLFRGVPILNWLYSHKVAFPVFASFAGPYASTFLDLKTYASVRETIDLPKYPLVDKTSGTPIDLFCERTFARYPAWIRHATPQKDEHLNNSCRIKRITSCELPASIASKLYHIRSFDRPMHNTIYWEHDASKLHDARLLRQLISTEGEPTGKGDGAVYSWSSAHAQTIRLFGSRHIYDNYQKISHKNLLNHKTILDAVLHMIETGRAPQQAPARPHLETSKARTVNSYLPSLPRIEAG